ncbi:MAG: hypothetical protein WD688_04105 [Candidatus Binatia bacterium]
MRHWSLWCFSALIFAFADLAPAKEVVIVTSFPKELFETYKKTFEAKHPGNRKGTGESFLGAGVSVELREVCTDIIDNPHSNPLYSEKSYSSAIYIAESRL